MAPPIISKLYVFVVRTLIRGYRYSFSYLFGRTCRFQPTCSVYAEDALRIHGAWKGTCLALQRLSRCHPWGGHGYDPVPTPMKHEQDR
jgi:putative membrane protein insertion efficiency factor